VSASSRTEFAVMTVGTLVSGLGIGAGVGAGVDDLQSTYQLSAIGMAGLVASIARHPLGMWAVFWLLALDLAGYFHSSEVLENAVGSLGSWELPSQPSGHDLTSRQLGSPTLVLAPLVRLPSAREPLRIPRLPLAERSLESLYPMPV